MHLLSVPKRSVFLLDQGNLPCYILYEQLCNLHNFRLANTVVFSPNRYDGMYTGRIMSTTTVYHTILQQVKNLTL